MYELATDAAIQISKLFISKMSILKEGTIVYAISYDFICLRIIQKSCSPAAAAVGE